MATAEQRHQFAQALQRAREDCGLSQRELAAALKVTQASVSQWLLGQSAPRPERVAELERVLRLAPDMLARHLGYVPWSDADRERSMTVAGPERRAQMPRYLVERTPPKNFRPRERRGRMPPVGSSSATGSRRLRGCTPT